MSVRTALVIAATVFATGFSLAATPALAATKNADKAACSEHVKKMNEMKTSAEREAYCKEHEDCMSHHCTKYAASHKKSGTKKKAAAPAPATPPPAN